MSPHRLRAPSADGALLAEPPLSRAADALAENAARLDGWDHDFQGRTADRLRPLVRGQVIDAARAYLKTAGLDVPDVGQAHDRPFVVTGHQPELFHPGVWIKNFATASVASRAGGVGLNLIVDNDIPKAATVRVPTGEEADGRYRVERVAFDDWRGEVPYEDLTVADEEVFASFAGRLRQTLTPDVIDPFAGTFWPRAVAARAWTDRAGYRFATARRAVEAEWGIHNLEVPLSAVCETEGFLWFACHLLAHLPRFQQVHNEALNRYRELYGIRSKNHPVPALTGEGDWLEAPFWVWRRGQRRRRPLLARQLAKTMELRIVGEDTTLAEIPLGPDRDACCAVDALMALPAQGVRLRTRALTTTMFARFLLGDLFIHGIGGAKYDELGDEIAARFFGVTPPHYMTVSMTLWPGLPDEPDAPARVAAIDRGLRDLTYNPDRHLDPSAVADPEVARLVEAKRAAVAGPVETHPERLERFHEIRRCNEALQGLMAEGRERLKAERVAAASGVERNLVAHGREFSMVVHSERRLREAMTKAKTPAPAGESVSP